MVNREGWTCPTCRRNYAPWVPSCNCINSAVGVNTTSITITPHTDDITELVEALVELLRYFLEWREEIESDLGIWASMIQTHEAFDRAEAALARVKGGER